MSFNPDRERHEHPHLADVIDRIAVQLRRGEPVDLDRYIQDYPAYADRLRELYPALHLMAQLSATNTNSPTSKPAGGMSTKR